MPIQAANVQVDNLNHFKKSYRQDPLDCIDEAGAGCLEKFAPNV